MANTSYEERFCWLLRWMLRGWRGVKWRGKGIAGVPRSILVELRWRLGDEIMAIPIYEAFRAHFPDCRVAVLCNYPELLEDNPFVGAVNPATPHPDRYILLRSGPRDVYRLEHYARCAGIPTPRARPRLYYRDWSTPLLDNLRQPLIAVSSGASWPTKRWPIDRWRDLCRELEASGHAVVQLGRGDECIGVGECLVDRTAVRDAACILHAARLFIGCDSGLMHLALAAGTRALALFGPTEPTILIRDDPNFAALTCDEPCQGCWNTSLEMNDPRVCPRRRSACLDSISAERVLACARSLLNARG